VGPLPARYGRGTNELDFRVLGPLQVASNGTFLPLGGAKQRAVLALLLLHANEAVSTDRLIDELWGAQPPESAANMLQGYVSHLRRVLEPEHARGEHQLLVSRPPGYALDIRRQQLDAGRFAELTTEGRRLLEDGDPAAAARRLEAALALWRGPALADFAYVHFAQAYAEHLEELRLVALESRIDADLALGRHDVLVGELRELVSEHPLRERFRAQLMTALYRCGRQSEALDVYRQGRDTLRRELGLEPGPTLRELEHAILRQDPALGAKAALPRLAEIRRRRLLLVGAAVLLAVGLAAVFALRHRSSDSLPVTVRPHSVAVIDPATNAVMADIPVGSYPGPLAADDSYVYAANIGDATVTRIAADTRKIEGTFSLSRAVDLVAVNHHLWSANGGVAGHTPFPPGTVTDLDLFSFAERKIRVGPPFEGVGGNEASTTIAAGPAGARIWAGNKESGTLTELDPVRHSIVARIHGVTPGEVAATDEGVWASDQARNLLLRVDTQSGRIIRRIAVSGQPSRLVADRHAVWVVTRGTAKLAQWVPTEVTTPAVWRIDPRTNSPVERIRLPLTPIRIALGAGSVWVTGLRVLSSSGATVGATVLRIDPRTDRIVARVPLRTRAVDGIVVSHGLVWVAVPLSQ
jgi:DNA-binding SARP family transcriptional activator/DNA-binding beta-propeller fold protein YncE